MPAGTDPAGARAFALLYCAPEQQPVLRCLLMIEAELQASLALEHSVAHARLSWWRDECVRTARGAAVHPLTRELTAAFAARGLAAPDGLAGLVDTAVWDLAGATFERRNELAAYCARWNAGLIAPFARFAGASATSTELGTRLRELELLLALPADARDGRLRLPLDELSRAQLPAAEAAQILSRPPWPAAVAQTVAQQHQRLRQQLREATTQLTDPQCRSLRGILVWAALLQRASRRAQRRLPAAPTARDHHAPLDGVLAWRAARRAAQGKNFS